MLDRNIHPALASGYLAPQLPTRPVEPPQTVVSNVAPPAPVAALQAANFELQSRLEKCNSKILKFDAERNELLDRLEKALVQAARLKDIQVERDEYLEKFEKADAALRNLSRRCEVAERDLAERDRELQSLRAKYFSQRQQNDHLQSELKIVSSASDIAKREIDNHLSKLSLREVQLSTARNLAGQTVLPGDDELNMAAALYENAIQKTHVTTPAINNSPFEYPPDQNAWRYAKQTDVALPEHIRAFLTAPVLRGAIFADGFVKVDCEVRVNDAESATVYFTVTNTSSAFMKEIKLVAAEHRHAHYTQYYSWEVQEEATGLNYLRPGQSSKVIGAFTVKSPYLPNALPKVCLNYMHPDGLPKSSYIQVPLVLTKFLNPLTPTLTALVDKWKEFSANEVQFVGTVSRDDLKSFSSISNLGEVVGSLRYQRGVDPNPRGAIFAGAWGAGNHGKVHEIIARIEMSPSSWPGPTLYRVSVRSPAIVLSESVARSLASVLV